MAGMVNNRFYRGTPLIRSPMGQTNLAVLRGDRINEGFFTVWPFCQVAKKSSRNNEVPVRRGFTVFKCILMIFMLFMMDITRFPHCPNPKEKWRCMELHFITSNMNFCMSELYAFLDTSDSVETCE